MPGTPPDLIRGPGMTRWGQGEVDFVRGTPLAARSDRTYISPNTEPRPTMKRIGASEARRLLP